MPGKISPAIYKPNLWGTLAARPLEADVPEGTTYWPTDETAVYQQQGGVWVKVADLTGNIPWEDITNKPLTFAPSIHSLMDDHNDNLDLNRVDNHDFNAHAIYMILPMSGARI